MWWWWWVWVAFLFFVIFVPLIFGWGRRGWGPPYPRYYRRRDDADQEETPIAPEPPDVPPADPTVPPMQTRTERSAGEQRPGQRWAWLADIGWLGVLAAIGWAIYNWVS